MLKFSIICGILLCTSIAFSQKHNDAIKINLSGLIVKNISVQYERKVAKRISVALNYRTLPYGTVPFSTALSNQVNNASVDFSKMNVGSSAITPEVRFYVGKKKAMRGFYLGPFASFSNYKTDFPINFSNRSGIFSGNLKATTGGLQLGAQMRISNRIFLDWWILGPNIGNGNGNLNLAATLTPTEQSDLRDQLEKLKGNVPLGFIQSYTVDSNGANVVLNGPWAGLRGLGFNLSFQF